MKMNQILMLCWGVFVLSGSNASEPESNQVESSLRATAELLPHHRPTQQAQSQEFSVFGIANSPGSIYQLMRQRELLEASARLATLLREIKSHGNAEAVLGLLESMNEHESAAQFATAFAEINLDQPARENHAEGNLEAAVRDSTGNPALRRRLIPVLAQTAGEEGAQERVTVMIGERRYSRSPGESIEFDGRVVVIDAIETEVLNGNEVTTIWVREDGIREALQWLP